MTISEHSSAPLEQRVAEAFSFGGTVLDVQPLGRGLINDTFLVTTNHRHGVLQRINRKAFPQPELIMGNLRVLTDFLRARVPPPGTVLRLPEIVATRDGKDYALDAHGGFWRALGYIENTRTLQTIASLVQAEEVGSALGRFHALVGTLEPERLHATRPRFHKTPHYFERFTAAAAQMADRGAEAELDWCVAFANERREIVSVLEDAKQRGELRLHVIHGDPKLDNFLFDARGETVVSLIDLDTVQPGLVHYDIGDCIRSCANPAGESPDGLDDVRFDLDICRSMLKRYCAETRDLLKARDYAYFFDAIRLIPFELGLRFLTDHLQGDLYFKTSWRGHNLHRAMAQFRLTAEIEKSERQIEKLVSQLEG